MTNGAKGKLEQFFSESTIRRFRRGEIVLRPGEAPPGVFYLKRGYFRLFSISESGEELTLIIFKRGDIFPISWAMDNFHINYFLEALTSAEAWLVGTEKFISFIKGNPNELYELNVKMMARLLGFLARMEYMVFGNARTKIASILWILTERFGVRTDEGYLIEVPLTHGDIANLVGLARETTSLEMEHLKKKGVINYHEKKILVKSLVRLKRESTKS